MLITFPIPRQYATDALHNLHSDNNLNAGYGIGSYAGLMRVPVSVTMPVTIFIPIRRHIPRCPLTVGRSDK